MLPYKRLSYKRLIEGYGINLPGATHTHTPKEKIMQYLQSLTTVRGAFLLLLAVALLSLASCKGGGSKGGGGGNGGGGNGGGGNGGGCRQAAHSVNSAISARVLLTLVLLW